MGMAMMLVASAWMYLLRLFRKNLFWDSCSFPKSSDIKKLVTYWLLAFSISATSLANATFTQPAHDSSVGAIGSQHQVRTDGSANYAVPINSLNGRAGVHPQLAFTYNSNGSKGLLGQGWSLSGFSVIQRCPTTLEQDGYIDGV